MSQSMTANVVKEQMILDEAVEWLLLQAAITKCERALLRKRNVLTDDIATFVKKLDDMNGIITSAKYRRDISKINVETRKRLKHVREFKQQAGILSACSGPRHIHMMRGQQATFTADI